MAFNVAAVNIYGSTVTGTSKTKTAQKPAWNPNKVYHYLEDMNQGFQDYRKQAVSYYASMISKQEGDGTLTVEELKKEIQELFPEYTLTDSEPANVTQGKFYLYIDQSQLKKLASDPSYRAKVYGLMDSELQGKNGYTLQYSDGRNVTAHLTGSIFSLAESNHKYAGADGIPYRGSCTSDHSFSTSASHPQVRSMSFLYDHLSPEKSAAKDRKSNATKAATERLEKKQKEKRAAKRKAQKEAELERLYDSMQYRTADIKYRNADDIAADMFEDGTEDKKTYESLNEYIQFLRSKYESMKQGIVSISHSFLRECLGNEEKQKKLEGLLADADYMLKDAEEHIKGFQSMKIKIDKDGNMETETSGGSVTFNEGKRARQLAAAKTPANVRAVMALLAKDLSDCENGVATGMCDESEVAKVKAMIQKAQRKMSEVMGNDEQAQGEPDTFSLNLLM